MENTLPTQPAGPNPAPAVIPGAQPATTTPQPAPAAAQTSVTQPNAPATQPNKKTGKLDQVKILTISLVVLGALILVLGVTNIIALIIPRGDNIPVANTSDSNTGSSASTEPDEIELDMTKPFEELTKEEALVALRNMNKTDYAPTGFFDSEMQERLIGNHFVLGLSYIRLDEITMNDGVVSNARNYDLDIEEIDDTHAFYYPMLNGERVNNSTVGIAFNKNYLNYYREKIIDTDEDDFAKVDFKNTARYNDVSADFIKKTMPILAVVDGVVSLNEIYDFDYSEDDEKVVLTLYNIKAEAAEKESSDDEEATDYELILYLTECYIDKTSFEFGWITDEYDEVDYIINSFPLEEAEFNSLAGGE